jgi:hypothetical protein
MVFVLQFLVWVSLPSVSLCLFISDSLASTVPIFLLAILRSLLLILMVFRLRRESIELKQEYVLGQELIALYRS